MRHAVTIVLGLMALIAAAPMALAQAAGYRIQPGDTLGSIAAQHGTTVRDLQASNGLRGSRIAAGDVLTIETGSAQD